MRLAPRCAPVHAHHAVVQLEGRAPWTKFRILLETRRAAETTNGDVRFFYVTLSPSDRGPPVEHPHVFHICSTLGEPTIWWPSVELQRWSAVTTSGYVGRSRVLCLLRRALTLRPIEVLYEPVPRATRATPRAQI